MIKLPYIISAAIAAENKSRVSVIEGKEVKVARRQTAEQKEYLKKLGVKPIPDRMSL